MVRPDDLICRFPKGQDRSKSVLILKTPKTDESERVVYFTDMVKEELLKRRDQVILQKAALGDEYHDYGLVFALENGNPIEPKLCEKWFIAWQTNTKLEIPKIRFHDLRGSSSSYKLIVSQGDVKTVQGDTGHASADVLLKNYAKIQDDRRKNLTQIIQHDLYGEKSSAATSATPKDGITEEQLRALLLNNPGLLQTLVTALHAQTNGVSR